MLVGFTATYSFCVTFPQYWLKWWTESVGHTLYYTTGYMTLSMLAWLATNGGMW